MRRFVRRHTWWLFLFVSAGVALSGCAPATMAQAAPDEAPDKNYCPGRLDKAQERIKEAYRHRHDDDFDGGSLEAGVTGPFGKSVQVAIDTDIDNGTDDVHDFEAKTGLSDLVFNCSEPGAPENRCAFSVYLDGEKVLSNTQFVRGQMEIRCVSAGRHELRLARYGHTVAERMVDLESDVEHLISVNGTGTNMTIEIYARNRLDGRIPNLEEIEREDSDNRARHRAHWADDRDDWNRGRDHRRGRGHDRGRRRHRDRYDHDRDRDRYGDGHDHRDHGRHDDHHHRRRRDHDDDHGDWDDDDDDRHKDRHHDDDSHGAAMSSGDFRELLQQVKEAGFSDEKLGLVRTAASDNWFTADQAKRLVAQFDFKDPKIEAAVALHPRIVDRGNFFKVLSVFDFSSAKEEVRERTGYE